MEKNRASGKKIVVGFIVVVLALLVLLFAYLRFSGNSNQVMDPLLNSPIGNFIVGGQQQQNKPDNGTQEEKASITFAGYGRYEVSKDNPLVEMKNPEGNFVNMVFTLTDADTGEIIARTPAVAAGEFAYVNVYDFYKNPGTYNVAIMVSTFDSETNQPMNGVNQKMEIIVN